MSLLYHWKFVYQVKKEQVSMEEKDEFDMLVDTKSLEHRLGNSPEKMEKKPTKKGW